MNNKAFTLQELLITVIIIGVLSGLAVPNYLFFLEKMRSQEGIEILVALMGGQKAYKMEHGQYTAETNHLDVSIPQPANFEPPNLEAPSYDSSADSEPNSSADEVIAEITRKGKTYTLAITERGNIRCDGFRADYCKRFGYKPRS